MVDETGTENASVVAPPTQPIEVNGQGAAGIDPASVPPIPRSARPLRKPKLEQPVILEKAGIDPASVPSIPRSARPSRKPKLEQPVVVEKTESTTTVSVDPTSRKLSLKEIEADKRALTEFRRLLQGLVQKTATTSENPPSLIRRLWGQLSYDDLVGKYTSLLPILELPANLPYSEMALLGALSLKAGKDDIAKSVYEEIRFLTSASVALVYVMRGVGRFIALAGSLTFFGVYLFVMSAVFFSANQNSTTSILEVIKANVQASPDLMNFLIAVVFGCLGSVVSILLRLGEFETTKGRSREFLILSGSTLPIVGGIFAAVIASIIAAKIINLGTLSNVWLFIVIGFLSGFSERFTRNLLSVAESRFSGGSRTQKTSKAG